MYKAYDLAQSPPNRKKALVIREDIHWGHPQKKKKKDVLLVKHMLSFHLSLLWVAPLSHINDCDCLHIWSNNK